MATALPNNPDPKLTLLPSVLVVEDNADDFYFLERAFRQVGMPAAIHRECDGQHARDYLIRAEQSGTLPVCIVCDLMMPIMDGFELLHAVKSHPALCKIPFIVLSTSGNERDVTRAYQLGANSYIVKPSTFASLVSISQALRTQWFQANQRG